MHKKSCTIKIHQMEFYSFHGCMTQEARVGGNYIVNVDIQADLSECFTTDSLQDTLDYVSVYEIVKEQMNIRSHLIEHLAYRIIGQLKKISDKISYLRVEVIKLKPPIQGNVGKVSFVLEEKCF